SLSLMLPAVLALLALLAWWYVGRALRPVDDLLGQLDQSLARQRRFVADAAHELRSPVTAIRAQVESPHPGSADPTYASRLRDEAARLSTLVDDLLALARLDAQPVLHMRPLDLDDVVFAEAARLQSVPGLRVDVSGVQAARVEGDVSLLTRAVRNLVDNAARHAAGLISVQLERAGDFATLVVSDDGPGIPEDQRVSVFERFTRLDEARARDTGGVGLGLAIVADVAAAHGGTAEAQDNRPGARMVLRLPLPVDRG
ncbi:MAG: HAMP domain-containing sensor histidine kinase, partial [Marmoricola sp.]